MLPPEVVNKYPKFVVNRLLAMHLDLVQLVNEANIRDLGNLESYEFLLFAVPKKKRFGKLPKPKLNEKIETLVDLLNISKQKASDLVGLIRDEDFEALLKSRETGG